MIEDCYNVEFVARLALREKQIQQNIRPVIGVHKWFARRPGTLFRALTLAEFLSQPISHTYYGSHKLTGRKVGDPFMGGGTPVLEANRLGCDVVGYDINPMAWWVVNEEIAHLDLIAYRAAFESIIQRLRTEIGDLYTTRCVVDGIEGRPVKTFLWVKTCACEKCGHVNDLFSGRLLAEDKRHTSNVLICPDCGELNEVTNLAAPLPNCRSCSGQLTRQPVVIRGRFTCASCQHPQRIPQNPSVPLNHRMFAIEYYNPKCQKPHEGRFFKKPDVDDLAKAIEAEKRLAALHLKFVPDDKIPSGDESSRLHRWGYQHWKQLFHSRQLLGLELSARLIDEQQNSRVRSALSTNLSDLLRYQNSLCRYDTMALKVLDIFSVHGFPVGLISAEANLLGVLSADGVSVGSGGWTNIVSKYAKAKAYCDAPFEIRYDGRRKSVVSSMEWIGESRNGIHPPETRSVSLICGDGAQAKFPPGSLDAVFTDPPYFGNVQYSELMDFCYVWLRKLVGQTHKCFSTSSTRHVDEVVGNETAGRGINIFAERLGDVWRTMAVALKDEAPLAFTFHHNAASAYTAVAVAILDAGLVCSASLSCPAEMGGSIHINGTGSSIIDTVFVCRRRGRTRKSWLAANLVELIELVKRDLQSLADADAKPTLGDARCVLMGHLTRLAIWNLRHTWDRSELTAKRLKRIADYFEAIGPWEAELRAFDLERLRHSESLSSLVAESPPSPDDYAAF